MIDRAPDFLILNSQQNRLILNSAKMTESVSLDGERVQSLPNLSVANRGIALDPKNGRMFYCNSTDQNIWAMDIQGRNQKNRVTKIQNSDLMFFHDDRIFWYDGGMYLYSISFPTHDFKVVAKKSRIDHSLNLLLLSDSAQPAKKNPCENSGCSDLCLRSDSIEKYSCGCPTGIKFSMINGAVSNRECNKKVEDVMVLAQTSGLFSMSLDTEDHQPVKLLDYQSDDQQESTFKI